MKIKTGHIKTKSCKILCARAICCFLFTAACLFLGACGSKGEESNALTDGEDEKVPTGVNNPQDTIPPLPSITSTPLPTSAPTYHAVIYDNLSKGTRVELDISEGETLDLNSFTQLLGYDFIGCYDKQGEGGEQYIDIEGRVCTELVSDLVLYAWYEPKNYTLNFTCNGESGSQYGIQNANIAYDSNLRDILPLGKIVNDNELIYSVQYGDLSLADLTANDKILLNEATFRDSDLFANNSKITLDLKTTLISAEEHFGAQEVCIHDDLNQFEQRFKDGYICDSLSLKEFDFDLLESLGYNTVLLEVSCQVREKDDGYQEIYVYHTAYENNENDSKKEKRKKEKAMEDFLLVEKSHDCKERDVTETVLLTENIPLTKLKASDGIYVYYRASGLGEDDWYRVSTDIKIEFVSIKPAT